MVAGAAADPDVILLRHGILLGYDALSSLLVELNAATEILLRSQAQRLTLVQREIRVYVHLERSS